ncbi:hypothetical protein [Occultella gossypii]|uniref:ABC transporter permease n=1 Tax=Occultella gossypii TaxID=2800820 RepID=A0ABS7SHL2_9MICO|nr:hypothetical protein [Occultella gossypii]MBZ2199717.1 hypothetical protein [Occultella gossypii]
MAWSGSGVGDAGTLRRLVITDLRRSARRPQLLAMAALLVVVPPISGILALPGYAFDHWMSYFTVMSDSIGLIFPLVVALLTQLRLQDEWSNTWALTTRTRTGARAYFASRVLVSAVLAAGVFGVQTIVCFAVARATYTDHGYGVPLAGQIEGRFPFSQLWAVSPALYVLVFCLWVAFVAGTVAAWCTLLTAVIGNKFVALAAPLVLWFMANFGLAVLRLEAFSLPPFRFHITQQPIWTELAGWAAIAVVTAGLSVFVDRRDYQTPGIVRT